MSNRNRFAVGRRAAALLFALAAPLGVCASASAAPAAQPAGGDYTYATPTEQYLSMRHAYPPTQGLNPDLIAADPARWRGKTLELEGRLSGIMRSDGDSAILMLTTEKYGSLEMPMSVLPYWLQPGGRLRVLAVATGGVPGSDDASGAGSDGGDIATTVTIGVAQMQVVCVAAAADISAAEQRWQRYAAARAKAQQEAMQRAAAALAQAQAKAQARRSSRSFTSEAGYATVSFASIPAHPISGLSPAALAVYQPYRDFIWKHNRRLTAPEADAITSSVLLFSEKYDVDPRLVIALIIAESDFDPRSTSNKGAMGLGQIMPDEAHDLGLTNPYDPVQNVAGAVYLLRGRLDRYSQGGARTMDSIVLALASYNAGMGAVKKYGGVPPYRETQNYVKKITRIYQQLCAGDNAGQQSGG